MRAFVLCGGEGTRLRPYTYSIPKPMLPLGNKPILEFVVNNLKRHGVTDVTLTVGYLREQIEAYFGDGKKFGVKMRYLVEDKPMNTAGSIFPAKQEVQKEDETFVVVMGDHLTSANLTKMIDFHKKKKGIGTMGLKMQGTPLEYGVAEMDKEGKITGFKEKPILTNLINAGIYVLEPEVFDYIEVGKDFAKHVFPAVMQQGKKIYGYPFDEYWIDIGRLADYEDLHRMMSIMEMAKHG
ncbi:nucleotidyltransferase family protein [Candidatus Micrarchaeota archaeon]|nr:nucleotidyltransferase family protein [Candidatus Micrarchaeota archaeon]